MNPGFWRNRRVLLTGHTGFKGSWLTLWLRHLGADVQGFSLAPETTPNLFTAARVVDSLAVPDRDLRGDIRDAASLHRAVQTFAPEVVFHLAAQPLVRASYADPVGTYQANVLGTANLLETVRYTPSVRAVVVVTTDKVYRNPEHNRPFREDDPLGGHDPYSSSKAAAEHVTAAYRDSFLAARGVAVATARAGNVIGGGDWSPDRLIPDLLRGFLAGVPVAIRRPHSVRPWQHVLDPLHGYLLLAEKLLSPDAATFARAWNFGPDEQDAQPVEWLATRLQQAWGPDAAWFIDGDPGPHEAGFLRLDARAARTQLGWASQLHLPQALDSLTAWHRAHAAGADMHAWTLREIAAYEALLAGAATGRR